jgi:hypothetical protein
MEPHRSAPCTSRADRSKRRHSARGPYERYVLVIHTDEFFLDSATVRRFLKGATFRAHLITDVILGLSH